MIFCFSCVFAAASVSPLFIFIGKGEFFANFTVLTDKFYPEGFSIY